MDGADRRPIVGVLLAAGYGRRFGADKLLHPLADATPLAVAAGRALRASCPRAVAVVRPEQAVLAGLLESEGLQVVCCAAARGGMGHSLSAGVAASPDAAGWLVALADMPFIRRDTFGLLATALAAGAPLVAPRHAGLRGHPVGFAARWYGELLQLAGDEGARGLLRNQGHLLRLIETDDPGVLRDVDRPADLAPPAP